MNKFNGKTLKSKLANKFFLLMVSMMIRALTYLIGRVIEFAIMGSQINDSVFSGLS